jgi:hypothetical protein
MCAITYHDSGPSIIGDSSPGPSGSKGIVDPFFVEDFSACGEAAEAFPNTAQFEGKYRPEDKTPGVPRNARKGRFVAQVFDQGELSSSREDITGGRSPSNLLGVGPDNGNTGRLCRGWQRPGGAVALARRSNRSAPAGVLFSVPPALPRPTPAPVP